MLRTLLESNAPRQRHTGGAAASVVIHAALIAAAMVATASARSVPPPRKIVGPPLILTPTVRRLDQPPSESSRRSARRRGEGWVTEAITPAPRIPDLPLPWPGKVPVEIDPGKLLAADTTLPSDAGRARGWGGDAGPARPGGDQPATLATVDQPAALLAPPRPRYPDQLRAAGVTGRVVVRLVVDTTGRVEPGSVVIRESSHDLFTQSVRAVLTSLRFTPATAGGRKVRMLVDLPFEFRLNE